MATQDRKVQLGVGVDASGAKAGFDQIKADAQAMAQGVAQAGQDASKGIDGIGAAADKLSATQSRLVEQIKRTATLATEGRAAYLEQKAAILGVSDAVDPYIQKIRQAEAGQVKLGMSAAATAAALRQVGPQFTDIVTSIQAGQAPMTVLLQQGGQLKDVFGGVGPAAKALGGYILGLVTPLTVTAAAVGVLGFALSEGSKELKAFQNASTITGNAIGVSASQFVALRDGLGGIGTKGKAAEVLTEIAAKGNLTGTAIKGIAEAAILMEKATGQATAKTIEQFAGLAKSPADAAAKLNEQYNFLTATVYKQIKALEDQGKAVDAANLAEQSYADALKSRAQTVLDNAGSIEKAWRGITGAAKAAWDAMLSVGREQSPAEKLAKAAADVARIQGQLAGVGTFGETGGGAATGGASAARKAALEQELSFAKQVEQAAFRRVEIESRNSQQNADQARFAKLRIDLEADLDKSLQKNQLQEKEIGAARAKYQDLINAGLATQKELETVIYGIRKKYNETTGQSEVAGIRARTDTLRQELAALQAQEKNLLQGIGGELDKPTQSEALVKRLHEELATGIMGVARAEKARALAQAEVQVGVERSKVTEEHVVKALQESLDARNKNIEAIKSEAQKIVERAAAQEAINANTGKSQTAIEQETLAKYRSAIADKELAALDPDRHAAALQRVADQERLVKALQQTEYIQEKTQLTEAGRVANEGAVTMQLELSLLGRTQQEREKIIAQRRVEVDLAKEMARIDKLNLGPTTGDDADAIAATAAKRAELRAQASANAVVAANTAVNKTVLDEWQRTADAINNSLTDALLRGFESGKSFAQNLRDTLVNMFKTLVLRPIIQGVLSPVSGAISTATTSFTNSLIGNSTNSLFGNVGSAFMSGYAGSAASGIGSIGASGFGAVAGDAFLPGALGATGAGLGTGSALGIGSVAGDAFLPGALSTTASGGIAAGMEAALAAIPVYGWIALAALAVAAVLQGGETRSGASYAFDPLTGGVNKTQGPSGGEFASAQVKTAIAGTVKSIEDTLKAFGSTAALSGFQAGLETSQHGKGFVFAGGQIDGQNFGEPGRDSANASLTQDATQAYAAFLVDLDRSKLEALRAAGALPAAIAQALAGADIEAMGGDVVKQFLAGIQGVLDQRTALEDTLFNLTATDLEKLTKAREKERVGIDASNLSILDSIYAEQDRQKAEEEQKAAAQKAAQKAEQDYTDLLTAQNKLRADSLAGVQAATTRMTEAERSLEAARSNRLEALRAIKSYGDAIEENIRTTQEAINQLRGQASQAVQTAATNNASALQQLAGYAEQLKGSIDSVSGSINALRLQATQAAEAALASTIANYHALEAEKERTAGIYAQAQASQTAAEQVVTSAISGVSGVVSQSQSELDAAKQRLAGLQSSAADSLRGVADSIEEFLRRLAGTALGSNSVFGQAAFNRALFDDLATRALGGDTVAAGQLVGAAQNAVDSARSTSTSRSQFVIEEARIRSLLAQVAGTAGPAGSPVDQAAKAFAEATTAVTAAQKSYDDILARVTASGVDLTLANTADALDTALRAYTDAQSGVATAQAATTKSQSDAAAAATAAANALTAAGTLGIVIPATKTALEGLTDAFDKAMADLKTARDNVTAVQASQATADTGIVGQYTSLKNQLDSLLGEQSALVTGAHNLGVDLTSLGSGATTAKTILEALAASQTALQKANDDYAVVEGNLYDAGASLVDQYGLLNGKLGGYQDQLDDFTTRTAGLDFSKLLQTDPLGDLIDTYTLRETELAAAVTGVADAAIALAKAQALNSGTDLALAQTLATRYVGAQTPESFAAALAENQKYIGVAGAVTPAEIDTLYQQYLGRHAEGQTAAIRAGMINSGIGSLDSLRVELANSIEAQARGYSPTVQRLFDYLVNANLGTGITAKMVDDLLGVSDSLLYNPAAYTPVTTASTPGATTGSPSPATALVSFPAGYFDVTSPPVYTTGTTTNTGGAGTDLGSRVDRVCQEVSDMKDALVSQGLTVLSRLGRMDTTIYTAGRTGAFTIRTESDEPLSVEVL